MKRVGIVTWYTYKNYGTALQAVALNKKVRALGYEAFDVQYDPLPYQKERPVKPMGPVARIGNKLKYIRGFSPVADDEKNSAFDAFLERNLPLTPEVISHEDSAGIEESYDAFICGSDQVWSPRCFDSRYYLDFVTDPRKKIAYAPSFGCDEIASSPDLLQINDLVSRFGSLSVRERSGSDIVESITGIRPPVVVDPTLLLSAAEWDELSEPCGKTSNPYCLFYFLGSDRKNYKVASSIAKKVGLEILEVPVFERQLKGENSVPMNVGPAQFIDLVRNASLICTDSFHGMVFSTIYKRPFFAFERFDPRKTDSQNTRVYNFLELTAQSDALLRRGDLGSWKKRIGTDADWRSVSRLLEEAKDSSASFLSGALKYATGGDL